MDLLGGTSQELVGAAVVALLTLVSRRALTQWQRRRRLGVIRSLMSTSTKVSVVLPSFEVSGDYRGTARSNIFFMSMPEGAGVAHLSAALNGAHAKADPLYLSHREFKVGGAPFITLGGPSVNDVTGRLLEAHCPQFHIEYPEHVAHIGGMSFTPRVDDEGALIEDYGFMLAGRTGRGCPFIALWGVMAFGSLAATVYLTTQCRRPLFYDQMYLAVVHAWVEDAAVHDVSIVSELTYSPS